MATTTARARRCARVPRPRRARRPAARTGSRPAIGGGLPVPRRRAGRPPGSRRSGGPGGWRTDRRWAGDRCSGSRRRSRRGTGAASSRPADVGVLASRSPESDEHGHVRHRRPGRDSAGPAVAWSGQSMQPSEPSIPECAQAAGENGAKARRSSARSARRYAARRAAGGSRVGERTRVVVTRDREVGRERNREAGAGDDRRLEQEEELDDRGEAARGHPARALARAAGSRPNSGAAPLV